MKTKSETSTMRNLMLQKCPRCHQGNMFTSNNWSKQFMKMNSTCAHCGLDFCPEPGYYFGAMYFSFAIQVLVMVTVYIFFRLTTNPDAWTYVIWTVIFSLLLTPFNFRISRALWIYIFVPYKNIIK